MEKPKKNQAGIRIPRPPRGSPEKNLLGPSFQNHNKAGTRTKATTKTTLPKTRGAVREPGAHPSITPRTAGTVTPAQTTGKSAPVSRIQRQKNAATPFQPRFIRPDCAVPSFRENPFSRPRPFALGPAPAVEWYPMPEAKAIAPLEFEKPLVEFERRLDELRRLTGKQKIQAEDEISSLEKKLEEARREIYGNLSPWQRVQIVRHPLRPYLLDYLRLGATNVVELGGDRVFGDDHALIGGFATIGDQQVVFLGHQKGRDTRENLMRNFGCAHPEGYRKALRLMRLADRFGLPIVSFIDTPGAFPGVPSEERHIAEAIAVNIREMFNFRVPIVAVVIGEGGSGGALGIGVADRVLILENAYYSVISPEGCASILWKDRAYAPQAAQALRISAPDLVALKLVDEIVPEPHGGAHRDWDATVRACVEKVSRHLQDLARLGPEKLLESRQARYRAIGSVLEN